MIALRLSNGDVRLLHASTRMPGPWALKEEGQVLDEVPGTRVMDAGATTVLNLSTLPLQESHHVLSWHD
eukprot:186186-Amphidinium_carterae.1